VLAKRLSSIHGINAPEFFDKTVLSTFITSLREHGHINDDVQGHDETSKELVDTVSGLLRPTVLATIKASLN